MDEETLRIVALEERGFLHDMSNKLAIADGMTQKVLRLMKEAGVEDDIIRRQQKAVDAVKSQISLLKARRSTLHNRSS